MTDAIDRAVATLFLALSQLPECPEEPGDCFFLNAHPHPALSQWRGRLVCEQAFKPYADSLAATGIQVFPAIDTDTVGGFSLGLYLPSRQHEEILWHFARALALLKPGGVLVCAMANALGAKRYETLLGRLCGGVQGLVKHKCRGFWVRRAETLDSHLQAEWLRRGEERPILEGRFVSRPGCFCWDGIDRGTRLLVEHLPQDLAGHGADLGAGFGAIGEFLLRHRPEITALDCYEADYRALALARRNLEAIPTRTRLRGYWQDVTTGLPGGPYDWIVMNPPCHDAGGYRPDLGQAFLQAAAESLKPGGRLWLVANRQLPYEKLLSKTLRNIESLSEADGFKILFARK
ncbi:MAG: class I SAM-dependent methyltransferase [Alphaproteobacteria bacterium]